MRYMVLFLFIGAVIAVVAQQSVTEAPAGFTTPTVQQTISPTGELTVTAGSQSVSNGIKEPPGDTFALDQAQFERRHDLSTGLGPEFNATSCAECHQNAVTSAASQFTEKRVGHNDANGDFVNPTILINDGADSISGRSIINDRSICAQVYLGFENDVLLRPHCSKKCYISIETAVVGKPNHRNHQCDSTAGGQQDDLFRALFVRVKLPSWPHGHQGQTDCSVIVKEGRHESILPSFRHNFDIPALRGDEEMV